MNICILEKPGKCLDQIMEWLTEADGVSGIYAYENEVLFLEQIEILNPQLCLLQIPKGTLHGLRIAEIVRQMLPDCRIVILSETKEYALEAFEVGVNGYLLCPLDKQKFLNAVFWID